MLTVMERFGQISMHKISIKKQVQFFLTFLNED